MTVIILLSITRRRALKASFQASRRACMYIYSSDMSLEVINTTAGEVLPLGISPNRNNGMRNSVSFRIKLIYIYTQFEFVVKGGDAT